MYHLFEVMDSHCAHLTSVSSAFADFDFQIMMIATLSHERCQITGHPSATKV